MVLLAQIKVGTMTYNKIIIKEIISLQSSNTYIKLITSSAIGKFFTNIMSLVTNIDLFSSEVEDVDNLVLPIFESDPSSFLFILKEERCSRYFLISLPPRGRERVY